MATQYVDPWLVCDQRTVVALPDPQMFTVRGSLQNLTSSCGVLYYVLIIKARLLTGITDSGTIFYAHYLHSFMQMMLML